ncbi:MAG: Gfo/Idh/MocA family oxidoreductase [Acutalibacter sp.]|uniref:Gfo/Idh/MocA family protein n=1 Tax=unclassified Acutalibacter TaxID=2620728 RepID=UPI00216E83CD|nr:MULTISPECIES: Gfo/Idh/MocA family oxidoreductase [unclassified Acutalibacter]MCI9226097.1 Gfo/Idh/MocA family oxidoreductase [Acutalibacter sp.]
MAKLKIGFIGCGGIANQKHLPGMSQQTEYVDLCAFCDLIPERAEKAAKEYGTPDAKVYTDYHELLADPTIDAVHVLTPNIAHCEITVAALEAGKHVLCEKPMAATPEDAQKMLDARDRTGKMLTIGYQYRHFHENAVARKVVADGWLGDIYYAEATYLRRRGVPTWGVFTDKSKQGGGPLIDIGTHALDNTLFLMNNYDVDYVVGTSFEKLGRLLTPDVQGQNNWRGEPDHWNNETYDVEDSAVGQIKMKNGAVINLRASWAMNMAEKAGCDNQAHTLLCGTKGGLDTLEGRVRLNHIVANEQTISWVGDKIMGYIPGFSTGPAPISKEHDIWVKALRGEGELFVTADQAFIVTKILDAIYQSSKTGQAIKF